MSNSLFITTYYIFFNFYIFRSGSVRSENLENSLKSMAVGSYMTLDRRNSKGKNNHLFKHFLIQIKDGVACGWITVQHIAVLKGRHLLSTMGN